MILEELCDLLTIKRNKSARPHPMSTVKEVRAFLDVHPVIRGDREVTRPTSIFVEPLYMNIAIGMKFRVATEEVDGQQRAVLRGKVWPRDQAEPDAWTIEAVDESPNLNGSPGLYGNAKDAELYLDNIRVYENN